jgi:hypothetical protein
LVLEYLPRLNAAAALTRMLDMVGINPLFASAMHLVMAQRWSGGWMMPPNSLPAGRSLKSPTQGSHRQPAADAEKPDLIKP